MYSRYYTSSHASHLHCHSRWPTGLICSAVAETSAVRDQSPHPTHGAPPRPDTVSSIETQHRMPMCSGSWMTGRHDELAQHHPRRGASPLNDRHCTQLPRRRGSVWPGPSRRGLGRSDRHLRVVLHDLIHQHRGPDPCRPRRGRGVRRRPGRGATGPGRPPGQPLPHQRRGRRALPDDHRTVPLLPHRRGAAPLRRPRRRAGVPLQSVRDRRRPSHVRHLRAAGPEGHLRTTGHRAESLGRRVELPHSRTGGWSVRRHEQVELRPHRADRHLPHRPGRR